MLTDTLSRNSESNFPTRKISAVLGRPEQELLAYYEDWKRSKKSPNFNFDQAFIAGLIGQSKTTVSNFINQRFQNISREKQTILRQVIDLLGYKPSQSAQLIRAKEKKLIGVMANITKTPSKDYTSNVLEGIKVQASEYNYSLLIYDVTQEEQSDFIQRMPFLGLVDGLIIIGSMLEKVDYRELARHELPVSLINPWSQVPQSGADSIVACIKADLMGLEDLLRHYREQVKAPLLLTIAVDKYEERQEKIDLYQKYYDGDIIFLDIYRVSSVEKALHRLDVKKYDAFFCMADIIAICVKYYLLQIDHKAIVTGYSNVDLAPFFRIPSVSQNLIQHGIESFNKLFMALSYKKINGRFPQCNFSKLESTFVLN